MPPTADGDVVTEGYRRLMIYWSGFGSKVRKGRLEFLSFNKSFRFCCGNSLQVYLIGVHHDTLMLKSFFIPPNIHACPWHAGIT